MKTDLNKPKKPIILGKSDGTARLEVIGDLGVGGERGRVFKGNGIIGALSATDYKDPPKTLRTWTRSE